MTQQHTQKMNEAFRSSSYQEVGTPEWEQAFRLHMAHARQLGRPWKECWHTVVSIKVPRVSRDLMQMTLGSEAFKQQSEALKPLKNLLEEGLRMWFEHRGQMHQKQKEPFLDQKLWLHLMEAMYEYHLFLGEHSVYDIDQHPLKLILELCPEEFHQEVLVYALSKYTSEHDLFEVTRSFIQHHPNGQDWILTFAHEHAHSDMFQNHQVWTNFWSEILAVFDVAHLQTWLDDKNTQHHLSHHAPLWQDLWYRCAPETWLWLEEHHPEWTLNLPHASEVLPMLTQKYGSLEVISSKKDELPHVEALFKYMISKIDIDVLDDQGQTLVHAGVMLKSKELLSWLMGHADFHLVNIHGQTPLELLHLLKSLTQHPNQSWFGVVSDPNPQMFDDLKALLERGLLASFSHSSVSSETNKVKSSIGKCRL